MSYKIGDIIVGKDKKYKVTRSFNSANSGQGEWGFAECEGKEFFIKRFLSPVYPREKTPGSEKGIEKRRKQCHEFEKQQQALARSLSNCGEGGLVVKTVDFFKYGNENGEHYFKVSQKVDTSSLSDKVHTLDPKKRLFVMLTAAGAVRVLHKNGIIHLDLKPDNILIQEYGSKFIAKVIDFDSSILEGESAEAEALVGDMVYYSPEFARHINTFGEEPAPTKKSDIFSLGLIFCQYWIGDLPTFSSSYSYPYEAVLNDEELYFPEDFSKAVGDDLIHQCIYKVIQNMLLANPEERWSIEEVHENLKSIYHNGKLKSYSKPESKSSSGKLDRDSGKKKIKYNFPKSEKKSEKPRKRKNIFYNFPDSE